MRADEMGKIGKFVKYIPPRGINSPPGDTVLLPYVTVRF
jgi:hypothetical protein